MKYLLFLSVVFLSCDTGKLNLVASLNNQLDESSAIEIVEGSSLLWTIEDSGNKNNIYGIDLKGRIVKDIDVSNSKNIDWEDLTSDQFGNLYIGDFGDNNKKRKNYTIYKVNNIKDVKNKAKAQVINFKLPKGFKSKDFEAFFLMDERFFIFSKADKKNILITVPNVIGNHTAEFLTDFNLKGKDHKITSAAISANGRTIVLLNHDKLWKLTNFKGSAIFDGTIEAQVFKHRSQKEGICFKNDVTVFITDERNGPEGGNLYTFHLD
ncbi:hypothetical protein [Aestuariivivens sediminicola]|uniref:hypothetical protein n=1 Tax=Aestuariivivens sediminicola TaxID=2913560 RepID=UPI001F596A8A|nr:hypothetical protein [Aestuariivivens sediminicola]